MANKQCSKCIHKEVCKTADSCDGYVSGCEHFKEQKHGKWIKDICTSCGAPIPTDSKYDFIPEGECLFCYSCGADMRGEEDG